MRVARQTSMFVRDSPGLGGISGITGSPRVRSLSHIMVRSSRSRPAPCTAPWSGEWGGSKNGPSPPAPSSPRPSPPQGGEGESTGAVFVPSPPFRGERVRERWDRAAGPDGATAPRANARSVARSRARSTRSSGASARRLREINKSWRGSAGGGFGHCTRSDRHGVTESALGLADNAAGPRLRGRRPARLSTRNHTVRLRPVARHSLSPRPPRRRGLRRRALDGPGA